MHNEYRYHFSIGVTMIIYIAILNILDLIFTLLNWNNFEESNVLMNWVMNKPFGMALIIFIKLVIVNALIYFVYKQKKTKIIKCALLIACLILTYAVAMGAAIFILNKTI